MSKKIISTTMLFLWIVLVIVIFKSLFGEENTLVGVAGITAALSLLENDYTLNPIRNTVGFVGLEVIIGMLAFIASLNPFISLVVTFIVIFYLLYNFTYDTKKPIHVAFVLGYLFMLYAPVQSDRIGFRIGGLIFSGFLIMALQILVNKNKYFKVTKESILKSIEDIKYEIDLILNRESDDKIEQKNDEIHENIKSISEYIYLRREKHFDMSVEGKIKLSIVLSLESINITLKKIKNDSDNIEHYDYILLRLKDQLDNIYKFKNKEISSNDLRKELDRFIDYSDDLNCKYFLAYELQENISLLREVFIGLENKDLSYYDEKFSIPDKTMSKFVLVSNFNKNSLRFSYAFRAAITISLFVFIVAYFNIQNGKWIIFTLYSVIQPYLEETRIKGRNRVVGTVVGVVIFEVVFSIVKENSSRSLVILLVGYLSNYAKEYRDKLIFTTISALGVASIGLDKNLVSIDRLGFIILGTLIAIAVNKFILPYKIKDVTIDTISNSIQINAELLKMICKNNYSIKEQREIRNLIVINKMCNAKVSINNNTIQSNNIEDFLDIQRIMMNNVYFLFNNIKNKSIQDLDIPDAFDKLNRFIKGRQSKDEIDDYFNNLTCRNDKLIFIDIYEIFEDLKLSKDELNNIKIGESK